MADGEMRVIADGVGGKKTKVGMGRVAAGYVDACRGGNR